MTWHVLWSVVYYVALAGLLVVLLVLARLLVLLHRNLRALSGAAERMGKLTGQMFVPPTGGTQLRRPPTPPS